jgi:hypothetical protein
MWSMVHASWLSSARTSRLRKASPLLTSEKIQRSLEIDQPMMRMEGKDDSGHASFRAALQIGVLE